MQNVHFTPPTLAPLFGVNVSTIKRWVDKGYLDSEVTAGGHRRITREQLAHFIEKYPKYSKKSYAVRRLTQAHQPSDQLWEEYYQLLRRADTGAASNLIEKQYITNTPIPTIIAKIITPALRRVRDLYLKGSLSIYEEHRISFTVRMHIMRLDQFVPDTSTEKSCAAILACAPGEFDELALQILALVFKLHGWKTHVLGINIDLTELKKAANAIKPKIIITTRTYSEKKSTQFYNKLTNYAVQHKIVLAFSGTQWLDRFYAHKKNCWTKSKCVKYFPQLQEFEEFLYNYPYRAKKIFS